MGSPLLSHLKYYLSLPFSPVYRVVRVASSNWRDFLQRHRDVDGLFLRQEELERELDRARLQEADCRRLKEENAELRRLLSYRERSQEELSLAYVLGRDSGAWRQGIIIDVGSQHGLKRGTIVLSEGSIAGRIVQVNRDTSLVMLVNDPASSISAVTSRTGARGVLRGIGSSELEFRYLGAEEDVRVGDEVISAGEGGVFPMGYRLGFVTAVAPAADRLTLEVNVRPTARLEGVGHVFLLGELNQEGL